MAALTRRTWAEMLTEVNKRLGRSADATFTSVSGRSAHWIDTAYRRICLLWHHHELDDVDSSKTLAVDANSITLPASTYIILAVRLLDGATFRGNVLPERSNYLWGGYDDTAGLPKRYARAGDTLYFDMKSDASYTVEILRYMAPTAPDFATGSPATDRLFDEAIMAGAVFLGHLNLWDPFWKDWSEDLDAFLKRIVNPPLAAGPLLDTKEQRTIDAPHGGMQG